MATNGTGGAMSSAADLVLKYSLRADDGQPLAPRSQAEIARMVRRRTWARLAFARGMSLGYGG